jgi:hypothetical protein
MENPITEGIIAELTIFGIFVDVMFTFLYEGTSILHSPHITFQAHSILEKRKTLQN